MCGRRLPKYEEYMSRLKNFAQTLGIKVKKGCEDSEGSYSPKARRITLDEDNTESQDVGAFLHELGHAVDEMLLNNKIKDSINEVYEIVYRKSVSPRQRAILMNNEKRAWMYGRSIAKQLNIRLGNWYGDLELDCLKRYSEDS